MTTQQVTTQAPNNSGAPPSDPDAAKYEALRKELGIEAEGDEPVDPPEPVEPPEPTGRTDPPEPSEPPEPDHVPRAEHENIQRALREAREQAQRERAEKTAILQIIEQARAQRQPPADKEPDKPKIPDVNEDPIGHFKALYEGLKAKVEQSEQGSQQTAEQLQAQVQHQQLLGLVQQSEAAILDAKSPNAKPDYWEACSYLEGQRDRELARMYPDNNPYVHQYAMQQGFASAADLRAAVLNRDRWAVAVQALQMGVSPAEFYYSLAEDRGYQPKSKANGDGKDKGQKQIEAAKKGRAAAISISGGDGGRKGAQDMSLSDLADLSIEDPEAFDEAWEKMRKLGRLG